MAGALAAEVTARAVLRGDVQVLLRESVAATRSRGGGPAPSQRSGTAQTLLPSIAATPASTSQAGAPIGITLAPVLLSPTTRPGSSPRTSDDLSETLRLSL